MLFRSMLRMYLSDARQQKGYSFRRTAREAGMSLQHYTNIENGRRGDRVSFMIMARISKALGLSLDDMAVEEAKYQHEIHNEDY